MGRRDFREILSGYNMKLMCLITTVQSWVNHFQSLVSSVGINYKLNSPKRKHLWHEFQLSRENGKLLFLWKEMTTKLRVVIDDPLLEQ